MSRIEGLLWYPELVEFKLSTPTLGEIVSR